MATVTALTADRMIAIEASSVVSGSVSGTNLHLTTHGGTVIDAGPVQGPANTLAIGTVNTGAAGSSASATVTGTAPSQTLNLTIPKGSDGVQGGTSTQRDTIFGVPATTTAKASLANKAVIWYNVTSGLFETYYATTGTTGLTVPGITGASGWYVVLEEDKHAKGIVFENDVTVASGAITAATIINNIPSFTFKANRWYTIEWDAGIYGSVGDQYPQLAIATCAVTDAASLTTGLTVLMNRTTNLRVAGSGEAFRVTRKVKYAVDTTVQVKFQGMVAAGGGNFIFSGAAQNPIQYSITDQGMSGA